MKSDESFNDEPGFLMYSGGGQLSSLMHAIINKEKMSLDTDSFMIKYEGKSIYIRYIEILRLYETDYEARWVELLYRILEMSRKLLVSKDDLTLILPKVDSIQLDYINLRVLTGIIKELLGVDAPRVSLKHINDNPIKMLDNILTSNSTKRHCVIAIDSLIHPQVFRSKIKDSHSGVMNLNYNYIFGEAAMCCEFEHEFKYIKNFQDADELYIELTGLLRDSVDDFDKWIIFIDDSYNYLARLNAYELELKLKHQNKKNINIVVVSEYTGQIGIVNQILSYHLARRFIEQAYHCVICCLDKYGIWCLCGFDKRD